MSNSTFLATQNPISNPNHNHTLDNTFDYSNFELSDYLTLENGFEEDSFSSFTTCLSQIPVLPQILTSGDVPQSNNFKRKGEAKRIKMEVTNRIAFRTKSDLEVMDDGFKWRKYGKKTLKDSPNPRNYYRCSSGGCNVKKRVERDREDSSYVITTYEGVHNHESPGVIYYNEMPTTIPCGWSSQALHSSS